MTYKNEVLKTLATDGEMSSIACTRGTKRLLKTFGVMGESEESVIKRLMFKKATGKDQTKKAKYEDAI